MSLLHPKLLLKKLVYLSFDIFRSFGRRDFIVWVGTTIEYRMLHGNHQASFVNAYCQTRGVPELCMQLKDGYMIVLLDQALALKPISKKENIEGTEDKMKISMQRFFEVTNEVGFEPFITFGTLLGYVREQKFIAWDGDLDVGMFYEETDVKRLIQTLTDAGFIITENCSREPPHKLKCYLEGYPLVDIVFFKRENEHLLTFAVFEKKLIVRRRTPFRLIKASFYGVSIKIPENPEIFLAENYGNWQVPKRIYHYILDSKLTDYSLPEISQLAREVFLRYIKKGDVRAMIHYSNLFIEKLPAETVWRTAQKKLNEYKHLY